MRRFPAFLSSFALLLSAAPSLAHPGLARDLDHVTHALDERPEDPKLRLLRAEILNRQGKAAEAMIELELVSRFAPVGQELFLQRAEAHLTLGHEEQAEHDFIRFFALGGESSRARARLAAIYERSGRLESARDELSRALALKPDPEFALARSRIDARLSGDAHAVESLEEALRLIGDSAVVRSELIAVYRKLGRAQAALAHVDALLAQASLKAAYRHERARLLVHLGRHEEASRERKRGLAELEGRITPIHRVTRARLLADSGRRPEARRELESALAAAPALIEARELLQQLSRYR